MKDLLHQYVVFNAWANEKFSAAILELSQEQLHRELVSSFNTIYKTVLHMWGAQVIWRKRLGKELNITAPLDSFAGSAKALTEAWMEEDQQWLRLVKGLDHDLLGEQLAYINLRGDKFNLPVYQILQHVMNHGTYHRGQLVTMLRQVGLEKIPATDFSLWAWVNKQA